MKRVASFAALIAAVLFIAGSDAFAAPTPILFPQNGNVTCADLNAIPNDQYGGAFLHMSTDWEFKDDGPGTTVNQPLTSSNGWVLAGGMTANTNLFLSYTLNPATVMTMWSLSWNSPSNVDRLVSAVIVKGGPNGTNVYPYNPLDTGDTGPFIVPGGANAISHLAFCFEPFTAPSAADASISGRVVDYYGRGISGATISVVNLSTGEVKGVFTNSYGYYEVKDLQVGDFFSLGIRHRRYTFVDPVRTFSLEADLTNADFTANR